MECLGNICRKPFRCRTSAVLTPGNEAGSGPQDAEGGEEVSTLLPSKANHPISTGGAADIPPILERPPERSTPPAQESSLPFDFRFEGVKDMDNLKKLLEQIWTMIGKHEKDDTANITPVEVIKANLEPSGNCLSRLANVCFPPGGLTRDIASESHTVLANALMSVGNLHWIGAAFLILGSIVRRMDQMLQNKDSLKFLEKLSDLGGHLLLLFKSSEEIVDEEKKTEIDKRIKDGCSFVVAGVFLCFKHLESRSWTSKMQAEAVKEKLKFEKKKLAQDCKLQEAKMESDLQLSKMQTRLHIINSNGHRTAEEIQKLLNMIMMNDSSFESLCPETCTSLFCLVPWF